MHTQLVRQLRWLVLSTAALAGAVLWAAEPATPPVQSGTAAKPQAEAAAKPEAAKPDATKPGGTTEPAKPDAQANTKAADAAAKPEAPKAVDAAKSDKDKAASEKSSPQRFIPSEQVRADFDVSFPIDI